MNIRALVIHLERARDRRAQVDRILAEAPVPGEVLDAMDARTIPAEHLGGYTRQLHKPRYPFECSKAEIACFLSHRKAWQAIVDKGLDAGLIIEDDVEFAPGFKEIYEHALSVVQPGDFVRFAKDNRERVRRPLLQDTACHVFVPKTVGLGMLAQLVTREAARKLLAATEVFDRPVDTLLQMTWITGVRMLTVHPSPVRDVSETLGGTTVQHGRGKPAKLRREIVRPLYRIAINRRSRRERP
ncbi:glycosyltransferase family 25 protein [Oricola cellulosilytica]|uniref:Glycosyltransferase family 25 protein n=1 Tax=Oricola cellulosilytica TaxID=1429082 RepID=A0A4R0P2D2_9HYPH|nr:glycosyltransferase family 25 protein [Oricola cellulosilytica]TCD10975.1 glycosyltransferase family 25 protein [Oricola cellulosilytica]